jgi:NAD(P)-dependent dehydrogenase (short-subunit alcohol dehydrogenase family)
MEPPMRSERVWITGASMGIGEALARRLAGEGAEVIASARSADRLASLAAVSGGRIVPQPLDVTDHAAVLAAVERIEAERGPIDVAVLNAGTHRPVKAEEFTADGLRRLMELNLFGVASCLEALIPRMTARRRGRIAVVASVAGYRGLPTSAYYGASKAALINLAESLKFDLDRAGVTIQLVDPGFVETPLTAKNDFPMPFLISAEAAAERIAEGLRSRRFEIAFPTTFVLLLKLLRILPYRLYFPLVGRGTRA